MPIPKPSRHLKPAPILPLMTLFLRTKARADLAAGATSYDLSEALSLACSTVLRTNRFRNAGNVLSFLPRPVPWSIAIVLRIRLFPFNHTTKFPISCPVRMAGLLSGKVFSTKPHTMQYRLVERFYVSRPRRVCVVGSVSAARSGSAANHVYTAACMSMAMPLAIRKGGTNRQAADAHRFSPDNPIANGAERAKQLGGR
jgi:hypothetical protein